MEKTKEELKKLEEKFTELCQELEAANENNTVAYNKIAQKITDMASDIRRLRKLLE